MFKFAQHGQAGTWVSELLPHTGEDRRRPRRRQDRCTPRRSTTTRRSRSSRPASQQPGRPSIGAWLSYGLGSENENLPGVRRADLAGASGNDRPAALLAASGAAASCRRSYQGVQFRAGGRPGALPRQPAGRRRATPPPHARRRWRKLNAIAARRLRRPRDRHAHRAVRDGLPHADARARADRPVEGAATASSTCTAPTSRKPGTFAANCLLARRLAERGVRFIQLYPPRLGPARQPAAAISRCSARTPTRPSAALVTDLKQRGLLDDTLVIWGGEFGRTVYSQGKLDRRPTTAATTIRAASRIWMAGGGIKPGVVYGETDDFGYNVVADPVHVHDLQRDDPAPAGHRPQAADLQVPGPRFWKSVNTAAKSVVASGTFTGSKR